MSVVNVMACCSRGGGLVVSAVVIWMKGPGFNSCLPLNQSPVCPSANKLLSPVIA